MEEGGEQANKSIFYEGELSVTKPNPISVVIEALEAGVKNTKLLIDDHHHTYEMDAVAIEVLQDALPIAREMAEKLERYDELVEKADALGWALHRLGLNRTWLLEQPDCPAIIKTMLAERKDRRDI